MLADPGSGPGAGRRPAGHRSPIYGRFRDETLRISEIAAQRVGPGAGRRLAEQRSPIYGRFRDETLRISEIAAQRVGPGAGRRLAEQGHEMNEYRKNPVFILVLT